jgi:hypothetical protein
VIIALLIPLACALALLAAPADAAVLDTRSGTRLAAFDGTWLWNHQDPDGYRLVGRDGVAPVPPSAMPFDVSLGRDGYGRVTAAYSRCKRYVELAKLLTAPGDCTLMAYDMAAKRERSLGISGQSPSLHDGVLAYGDGRNVMLRRLRGGTPRAIARVSRYGGFVTGTAVSPRGVAFSTQEVDSSELVPPFTAVYFKPAGKPIVRLGLGGAGEENDRRHSTPTLAGPYLYWAFSNLSSAQLPNGWVMRYRVDTKAWSAAAAPAWLQAAAADPLRPAAPLLVSSVQLESFPLGSGLWGVAQVATLEHPVWGAPPDDSGTGSHRPLSVTEPPRKRLAARPARRAPRTRRCRPRPAAAACRA